MKQNQYQSIIDCIEFGAPALAKELITAFNQVMQNSNDFISAKMKAEEEARKAKENAAREAANKAAAEKANIVNKPISK